jgi:cysteine desulfurase
MAANNETGSLQPVSELGAICRSRDVRFHTDAVQFFGKQPLSNIDLFNADLVSLCAHKFHGPKGAGALYVRSPLRLDPILFGGSHENDRRPGTENLPAIIGLVEAAERFLRNPVFPGHQLNTWTELLASALLNVPGLTRRGSFSSRLSNTLAFTVESSDSIALLAALDLEGICASSGSACSSGSVTPSHVLLAMGVEPPLANSFIRFSLGRETSESDVARVAAIAPSVIERARHSST